MQFAIAILRHYYIHPFYFHREFDIHLRDRYSNMSDDTLDAMVREALGGNRRLGSGAVKAKLQAKGIHIQRQKVWDSVSRVDPVGVALRSLQPKLERIVYSVPGPNSLWHIDGNHKLIRYSTLYASHNY